MAHFGKDLDNFSASRTIKITGSETNENFTVYNIEVAVGHYVWTVKHRYSNFHDLHEKLVSSYKIDKSLLPPKKIFGNQSESFIKRRQNDLEVYLQTVLYYVAHKIPPVLASFLNFDKYEIHGITQSMAEELYNKGDVLLQSREVYTVTPLQLYSLTERLKLPEPTCDSGDVKKDIGHILDFITRVRCLKVVGSKERVGTSNIDMTQLKFDLSLFKSLQNLEIDHIPANHITGLDTIKETLERLCLNNGVTSVREILLQDMPQWKAEDGTLLVSYWDNLMEADFSENNIKEIDDSVQLMPRVEVLDLSHNQLECIQHLNWLSQLTHLDLSNNLIKQLDALHTKLGNLKILNLAGNKLDSLKGLSKLFSLETLDVRDNQISQLPEVKYVCCLPCIEYLYLMGNPVNNVLDYRTKVLEMCGDRVLEVCLDQRKPTQKELDTVAVLQAIQKSKENKGKKIIPRKVSASEMKLQTSLEASTSPTNPVSDDRQSPGSSPGLGWSTHGAPAIQSTSQSSHPHLYNTHEIDHSTADFHSKMRRKNTADSLRSQDSSHSAREYRPRYRTVSHEDTVNTCYIPASNLPNAQDTNFMSWMQKRLFGSEITADNTQEKLLNLLWCGVIQFTRQECMIPCCAVLTQRRVFILRLKTGDSGYGEVPDLETFYILPLCNVQEVLIGPCYSYIRLEESFVGASGTFALIAADSDVGKSFSDSISLAYENGNLGPLQLLNCSQDSDLAKYIFSVEDDEGLCTGRIAFSMFVTIAGVDQLSLLMLSENKVYLVHSDCLFWPRPSFLSQLEDIKRPNFLFLQHHSIMAKISDISMNIILKASSRSKKASSFHSLDTTIQYERFGISMVYHELIGPVGFHIYFISAKARDDFLNRLTSLRSELAHRMSPTIREEPEGGNESSDSLDNSAHDTSIDSMKKDDQDQVDNENTEDVDNTPKTSDIHKQGRAATIMGIPVSIKKPEPSASSTSRHVELLYLTKELGEQLKGCIQNYNLATPIPSKLRVLTQMNGHQLAEYFHSDISMIGVDMEQLHFVMWAVVVPYQDPRKEIVTCVMLTTRAIYLVSNQLVRSPILQRQAWMTHTRHKSDSVLGIQTRKFDEHHTSGILHSGQHEGTIIRSYHVLQYSDLHQINVGLFDQCVRLTGNDENSVFTMLTRDSSQTERFLHQLTTMLSIFTSSPMLDKSSSDLEQDFYRAFDRRTKTTVEGMEYTHPSKVQFLYPGEDVVSDLLYTITEHLRLPLNAKRKTDMLNYILCYMITSESNAEGVGSIESRSLVLTNQYLCLIDENVVNYPLPDFVRGLPNTPRYTVNDIHKIASLKRVLLFKGDSQKVTLIFSDEPDEICVDTTSDHFSLDNDSTGRHSPPEVGITILIQCQREVDKFMLLLRNQWRDLQLGEMLEVHTL